MSLFRTCEPEVEKIYQALLTSAKRMGPFQADAKKTSIHLVAQTAFAGVHPRKQSLLLNIRTAAPLKSRRVRKIEQVSANRFHNEVLVCSRADVDGEIESWLRSAYQLATGNKRG